MVGPALGDRGFATKGSSSTMDHFIGQKYYGPFYISGIGDIEHLFSL
jgi:hypothetical protein